MEVTKYSPVLDYKMIIEKSDLFSFLECYNEALSEYKIKSRTLCKSCLTGARHDFAQSIRNELIERKIKHVFQKLEPNTIIRYGKKIFRAYDFI
jgi:hypothetical protein